MMQISLIKLAWTIFVLHESVEILSLMVEGTIRRISDAKYEIVSVPCFTVLGLRLYNPHSFLRVHQLFVLKENTLFSLFGERPFTNLYISIAKLWRFL